MIGSAQARAYGLLVMAMALVGGYVAFSKIIVAAIPVFSLAAIRFALAAVMMLPWTFPTDGWRIARTQLRTLFLLSLFGNFLFSIFMLSGVARTTATAAGVIMSTLPAVVALASLVLLRERITRPTQLAIVLAIAGMVVLTILRNGSAVQGRDELTGNLFMIGAVCCEALYVVLGKRLTTASLSPMQISAWINLVGLCLMAPFGVWQGRHFAFMQVPLEIWILGILYAAAASVISTWVWVTGVRTVPASQAGVFTVALPITSAAIGVAFLGEHFTLAHVAALGCAIAGLILIAASSRR